MVVTGAHLDAALTELTDGRKLSQRILGFGADSSDRPGRSTRSRVEDTGF